MKNVGMKIGAMKLWDKEDNLVLGCKYVDELWEKL